MRLSKGQKKDIEIGLIEKAFPKEEENQLREAFKAVLNESGFLDERKKLYEDYSKFIRGTNEISVRGKNLRNPNTNRRETISVPVSTSCKFAIELDRYWDGLAFNVDDEGLNESVPQVCKAGRDLIDFEAGKREFQAKLSKVLEGVQSSTPLLEVFPEAEEFIPPPVTNALIDQGSISYLRNCLNKGEKE